MACFESGVSRYIKGVCVVEVGFPVDMRGHADISCNQCPFYHRSTRTCFLNHEIVAYPDRYVGYNCPLEILDDEKEGNP